MFDPALGTLTGHIFDIQRFSIHDGPGIRTTVFLKGCPLQCSWCHNPEGQTVAPQLSFMPTLCIGCGYCMRQCKQGVHVFAEGKHRLRRENCVGCFACTEECYAGALEVVGKERSVGEILDVVLRDRPFYEASGGGLTLGGGEPLAQPEFAAALLSRAADEGLHTCLETSGSGTWEALQAMLPATHLFLFDCKETDPERHKVFTGHEMDPIHENLRKLDAAGAAIILRCPLVAGYNLREDHLDGIAMVAHSLRNCQGVHLMAFHKLGESKRDRLGMKIDSPLHDTPGEPRPQDLQSAMDRLRSLGVDDISMG